MGLVVETMGGGQVGYAERLCRITGWLTLWTGQCRIAGRPSYHTELYSSDFQVVDPGVFRLMRSDQSCEG